MEHPVESQGRDTKEEPVKPQKVIAPVKREESAEEIEAQQEAGGQGPASTEDELALSGDYDLALENDMERVQSRIDAITKKLSDNEVVFSTLVNSLQPTIHDIRDNGEAISNTSKRIIVIRVEKKKLEQELGQLWEEKRCLQLKVTVRDKERQERSMRGPFENTSASVATIEGSRPSINGVRVEETEKES